MQLTKCPRYCSATAGVRIILSLVFERACWLLFDKYILLNRRSVKCPLLVWYWPIVCCPQLPHTTLNCVARRLERRVPTGTGLLFWSTFRMGMEWKLLEIQSRWCLAWWPQWRQSYWELNSVRTGIFDCGRRGKLDIKSSLMLTMSSFGPSGVRGWIEFHTGINIKTENALLDGSALRISKKRIDA